MAIHETPALYYADYIISFIQQLQFLVGYRLVGWWVGWGVGGEIYIIIWVYELGHG